MKKFTLTESSLAYIIVAAYFLIGGAVSTILVAVA